VIDFTETCETDLCDIAVMNGRLSCYGCYA